MNEISTPRMVTVWAPQDDLPAPEAGEDCATSGANGTMR